jgi:hypothetical protein
VKSVSLGLIVCFILLAVPVGTAALLGWHVTRYWTLCLLSQTFPTLLLVVLLFKSQFRARFKPLSDSAPSVPRTSEGWHDLTATSKVSSLILLPGIMFGLIPVAFLACGLFKWDLGKMQQHLALVLFCWFTYSVTVAYLFASHGQMYVSLFLCSYLVAISVHATLSGFQINKGVMRLLNYPEGSLSPMSILAYALLVDGAFGCLHFDLRLLNSSAYHGLQDWQDSLYFSTVTLGTVGYGDITPLSHVARLASMLEIIIGFVILVMALNATMSVWLQRGSSRGAQGIANVDVTSEVGGTNSSGHQDAGKP